MITGKSLHNSNTVFVMQQGSFVVPENGEFSIIYTGAEAEGMHFIDDPAMQVKLLTVPKLGVTVTLDGGKLKIDDIKKRDFGENNIVKESIRAFNSLFPDKDIVGFGFNMDIYYRFDNAIPIELLTDNFVDKKLPGSREITDFGFQFSARNEKSGRFERYFFKIAAPLELIAHVNHHYTERSVPKEERLKELFAACYNETDEVIEALNF
ncbi:MAG: hypothetical protein CEN90_688 [Parcubacteria group bacterium Licking1014_17]|nr:MAG: hypothetical protein CEN90_688 [Parcubacteria group bacterium Licking1014_17]